MRGLVAAGLATVLVWTVALLAAQSAPAPAQPGQPSPAAPPTAQPEQTAQSEQPATPAPTAASPAQDQTEAALAAAAVAGQAEGPATSSATFTYANRPIVEFRATLLGRTPGDRTSAARQALDPLIEAGVTGPVETTRVGELATIRVGGRLIFAILPADIDTLAGETLDQTAALAASRLQTALDETAELRRPGQLLFGALQVLLATLVLAALAWALRRAHAAVRRWLGNVADRRLQGLAVGDVIRMSRIVEAVQRAVSVVAWALGVFLVYAWVTFGLRRFPYTRPWGESLREFVLDQLSSAGAGILQALPGLFTVVLIVVLTRIAVRLSHLFFQAVEEGRVAIPWAHPETARPTRKIVTAVLWLFALAIAYPYLPGSQSDAFKGLSVFVGLVISLGSSGLINQVMSGFTITFSRSLRVGDFVAMADIEGTVTELGTLATKIRTPRGEDITIPNALVTSQSVTNYSRYADTDGVFVPTSITIGYDVPWRQVEALLLLAAARTPGIRRQPSPVVRKDGLEDFYVRYTLMVCVEHPGLRAKTMTAVHENILDAFNEHGVQIMSPNYEADTPEPTLVPRERWCESPASPDSSGDTAPGTPPPPE